MNNSVYINKTIALSGIFQACLLIKQLAWEGKCNQEAFDTAIYSLLQIDSASVISVYQNLNNLNLGFKLLIDFLNKNKKKDIEITRYVFSLLYLEQKLVKRPDLINIIKSGITRANIQSNLFHLNHENVIANLAGIYVDTLSTFSFRIYINGNQTFLTNYHTTNKIRSILLAGIRSAVLWRQLGGSKLQLFFKKNIFLACAKQMLETPITNNYLI